MQRRALIHGGDSLGSNTRGSTYVEYLVLVGAVGIAVAAAVAWLGLPLLRAYRFAQLVLSAPLP